MIEKIAIIRPTDERYTNSSTSSKPRELAGRDGLIPF
jgi:hypothetical protein